MVEDDKTLLGILASILESEGHQVTRAASGHEGLTATEEGVFDVVVADFRMPRTDGLKLLEAVKLKEPDLPVVFVSAYMDKQTVQEAKKLGAAACLEKPFRLAELRKVLNKIAAKKEQQKDG